MDQVGARFIVPGVVYLGVSGGQAPRGVLGRLQRSLDEEPTVLLATLGTSRLPGLDFHNGGGALSIT